MPVRAYQGLTERTEANLGAVDSRVRTGRPHPAAATDGRVGGRAAYNPPVATCLGRPLSVLGPGTAVRRSGFFLFGAHWQGDLGYPKLAEAKEA